MGRLVFTSGEILTAANMNELSDQSVMVFADSSARSSAIPSPSEGMITYLEDTDAVEKFDGSAFVNVSPGGLVAVKSALFTGTQTASVTAGDNVAVTDLSITHEVSDPANRLIITAFFGKAGSTDRQGNVGIAVNDGSGFLAVGDASGSRTQVTAGGVVAGDGVVGGNEVVTMPSITFVHTPGAGSKTYTVNAINIHDATATIFINRAEDNPDSITRSVSASSIVIQEVAV